MANIDLGDTPVGTPPTEDQMGQMRQALGSGVIKNSGSTISGIEHLARVVDMNGFGFILNSNAIKDANGEYVGGVIVLVNTGGSANIGFLSGKLTYPNTDTVLGTAMSMTTGETKTILVTGDTSYPYVLLDGLDSTMLNVSAYVRSFLGGSDMGDMRSTIGLTYSSQCVGINAHTDTPELISDYVDVYCVRDYAGAYTSNIGFEFLTDDFSSGGYTITQIMDYLDTSNDDLRHIDRFIFVNNATNAVLTGDIRSIENASCKVTFDPSITQITADQALIVDKVYGYTIGIEGNGVTQYICSVVDSTAGGGGSS